MAEAGNTAAIFSPHFFCLHCSSPSAAHSAPHRGSPFCLPSHEPREAPASSACGTGAGAGKHCLHPMSICAAGELPCLWKNQAERGEWGIQYHLLTPLGSKSVLHKFWYAAQKYLIYCIKKKGNAILLNSSKDSWQDPVKGFKSVLVASLNSFLYCSSLLSAFPSKTWSISGKVNSKLSC